MSTTEEVMEYLTMTRIMNGEIEKWKQSNLRGWQGMTGIEQLYAESAYKDGFIAGFSGKYFGSNDD